MAMFLSKSANALDWLDHNPKTANILQTARELLTMEKLIASLLPVSLAQFVKLAHTDGQQIVLLVPGPAYAARVHQLSESITTKLNNHGWQIRKIIIRIDAKMSETETKKAYKSANYLDEFALGEFDKLRQNVAPGPLAEALDRLLEHHKLG